MDTSETYIKQCDCPEIQEQWEPKVGDILWHENFGVLLVHRILKGGHFGTVQQNEPNVERFWDIGLEKAIFTWLPRQDQLQEMVSGGFTHQTLGRFYQWYHSGISQYLSSMEQLWLAFVLHSLHRKKWDSGKWKLY